MFILFFSSRHESFNTVESSKRIKYLLVNTLRLWVLLNNCFVIAFGVNNRGIIYANDAQLLVYNFDDALSRWIYVCDEFFSVSTISDPGQVYMLTECHFFRFFISKCNRLKKFFFLGLCLWVSFCSMILHTIYSVSCISW